MFTLMISNDDGRTYLPNETVDSPEKLDAKMDQLDNAGTVWFLIDKDGEPYFSYRICRVHRERLAKSFRNRTNGQVFFDKREE